MFKYNNHSNFKYIFHSLFYDKIMTNWRKLRHNLLCTKGQNAINKNVSI